MKCDILKYEVWLDRDFESDRISVVVSAVEFDGQVKLVSSRVLPSYTKFSDIANLVWHDMVLDGGGL